jgi:integrase
MARLTDPEREEMRAWQDRYRWHPHQLRHTTGTLIRQEFGLEAAQLALGHSSAKVTDAVYAERDAGRVIEVMKRIG